MGDTWSGPPSSWGQRRLRRSRPRDPERRFEKVTLWEGQLPFSHSIVNRRPPWVFQCMPLRIAVEEICLEGTLAPTKQEASAKANSWAGQGSKDQHLIGQERRRYHLRTASQISYHPFHIPSMYTSSTRSFCMLDMPYLVTATGGSSGLLLSRCLPSSASMCGSANGRRL